MPNDPNRRRFFGLAAGLGAASLSGCDRLANNDTFMSFIGKAEGLTYRVQRWLTPRARLAPEYPEADITTAFKANGSIKPRAADYNKLARAKFANWKLRVDGLVETPLDLSLADLRALPARTQITRHDCVEGWSCIGKWSGPTVGDILARAKPKPEARFVIFHCFDSPDTDTGDDDDSGDAPSGAKSLQAEPDRYYESIDLVDAYHPQTILAHEMNGAALPVDHGAPLRVRVERQLGYKMAKYIQRIELVDSYANIGKGGGGYWEDRGYEWYAGI
jgi:DMSO/TMAO reductase YedYZ molybdopterin-dependent catalytic subunit